MNKKEEEILNAIVNYVKENHTMPTRRYLQKLFNYKSVNSITRYINSLEKQNYLKRNNKKLILNNYTMTNYNIKNIGVINLNNAFINIIFDKYKKYLAYKIHNDYFNNIGIFKGDLLIIERKKKLKDNDLGLFIVDNKYRVMRYKFKDGFYILNDHEELILSHVKLIGKVIMIERKL